MDVIALECEQRYVLKAADMVKFLILKKNLKNDGTYYGVAHIDNGVISPFSSRDDE